MATKTAASETHQDGEESAQDEADKESLHPRPPGQRRRLIGGLQMHKNSGFIT